MALGAALYGGKADAQSNADDNFIQNSLDNLAVETYTEASLENLEHIEGIAADKAQAVLRCVRDHRETEFVAEGDPRLSTKNNYPIKVPHRKLELKDGKDQLLAFVWDDGYMVERVQSITNKESIRTKSKEVGTANIQAQYALQETVYHLENSLAGSIGEELGPGINANRHLDTNNTAFAEACQPRVG